MLVFGKSWQIGLLDVFLLEHSDKSHNLTNLIFMTSSLENCIGSSIGISISINISVSVSASMSVCVSISIYHPCLTYLSRGKVASTNWAQWLHHAKGDCGRFLCPAICERCSAWNTSILCCSKNGGIHEAKDTNCGEFFFYVFSWLFGWIVRPALLLSYTIYTRGRPGRLWFIRGRPFDFGRGGEWGYEWFQKKYPTERFQGKRKNIYISHDVYYAGINLTPLYVGEKILTQTKSPIPLHLKSQMVGPLNVYNK